jgi:hypothetical protein
MASEQAFNAIFTPANAVVVNDRQGRPYARARGTIEMGDGRMIERTVLAQGKGYERMGSAFLPGRPMKIRGFYKRVQLGEGRTGGEFFSAFQLLQVFDPPKPHAPAANDQHPRHVEGHDRKGHWRRWKAGVFLPRDQWIWVASSKVNGGRKAA